MLRITYNVMDGLQLSFHPTPDGTGLALAVLAFLEGHVVEPDNKAIAEYFFKELEKEMETTRRVT